MASPASVEEFLDLVHKSGVADERRLDAYLQKLRAGGTLPAEASKLAGRMVQDGILTHFQAEHIMQGKWRRFTIGKYKILERIGAGGMGTVYLCEHKLMRCMRAIKILPVAKAQDESALSRFYREARAVAAIDHPNIVHAYDIDQDENLHFLVMEYVDGASLQDIVKKSGPLSVLRACHYIQQSAIGLDHAQRAGLVHRDIKPGNILVSREGGVKILDMGLARFFNDDDDILTRKFDENVLGTADYLAPEQALDSHTVDIRADIYSLGATFYYLLTGKTPFGEGTVAQKLFWHQSRQPKAVRDVRPEVPAALDAIITKMMAKDPAQRFQMPGELTEALTPYTQTPIGPPPESEMPRLSPAATGKPAEGSQHDTSEATAISKPETPRALQNMAANGVKQSKPATSPAPPAPPPPQGSGPRVASSIKPPPPAPAPTQTVRAAITTPAPAAPQQAAPHAQQEVAEPEPEEDFGWQAIANETEDLTAAAADTGPAYTGRRPTAPTGKGEQKAVAREKGVVLLVVALMLFAGFGVVIVGGGVWAYFAFFVPDDSQTVVVRPKLIVSAQQGGKQPGVYRSITAALHIAKKDDVIEIADEVIEENVVWEAKPSRATEVTIQAAPGKEVVWRSARKDQPGDPLLRLTNAMFFKLKGPGITLDGDLGPKGKVKDLVYMIGSSQGITIEDVKVKNFGRSGVHVLSATGNADFPIRIKGITALTLPADKEGSVVAIDARPDMRIKQVDHITVSDVQGPGLLVHAENGTLGDQSVQVQGLKKE